MRKHFLKYALLSVVLLLASCGKNDEYTHVIPSDVDILAVVDCQRIMEENAIIFNEKEESQQHFIKSFKKNLSASESALFELLVSNPAETGIDWRQKAFYFSPAQTMDNVFLFSVADSLKLKTTIRTLAGSKLRGRKFIEQDGYVWASTRKYHVALNDKICLLITNTDDSEDALKQRVSLWMNQKKDESFASTKYYDELLEVDGEIGLFAPITTFHENTSMLSSLLYSEDMDISSLKYMAEVSLKPGRVEANGKILYEDSKLRDWIHEQEEVLKKLDGTSLAFLPKGTPVWLSMGLDGDELYDHLLEHPTYGSKLKNLSITLDLDGVIRSIDGDLNLSYPFGMFVDVNNEQILRICVSAIQTMGRFIGLSIEEGEKNQYRLNDQNHRISSWLNIDENLGIGMKEDSFYFVSSPDVLKDLSKEESLASLPWAKEVEGNKFFIALDVPAFSTLMVQYTHRYKDTQTINEYFDYVTYSQKNIDTNKIVISFINKDRNVLEQLLEVASKIY